MLLFALCFQVIHTSIRCSAACDTESPLVSSRLHPATPLLLHHAHCDRCAVMGIHPNMPITSSVCCLTFQANQVPSPGQRKPLQVERMYSNIPKGGTDENWTYPSPQMVFNGKLLHCVELSPHVLYMKTTILC